VYSKQGFRTTPGGWQREIRCIKETYRAYPVFYGEGQACTMPEARKPFRADLACVQCKIGARRNRSHCIAPACCKEPVGGFGINATQGCDQFAHIAADPAALLQSSRVVNSNGPAQGNPSGRGQLTSSTDVVISPVAVHKEVPEHHDDHRNCPGCV